MNEHQGDHEVGAPAVQRAQIPSERLLVVQVDEAVPGAVGGWSIDRGQADAGDDLQDEHDQRRAAEYVPPARRAARHRMLGRLDDRAASAEKRLRAFPTWADSEFFEERDSLGLGNERICALH